MIGIENHKSLSPGWMCKVGNIDQHDSILGHTTWTIWHIFLFDLFRFGELSTHGTKLNSAHSVDSICQKSMRNSKRAAFHTHTHTPHFDLSRFQFIHSKNRLDQANSRSGLGECFRDPFHSIDLKSACRAIFTEAWFVGWNLSHNLFCLSLNVLCVFPLHFGSSPIHVIFNRNTFHRFPCEENPMDVENLKWMWCADMFNQNCDQQQRNKTYHLYFKWNKLLLKGLSVIQNIVDCVHWLWNGLATCFL